MTKTYIEFQPKSAFDRFWRISNSPPKWSNFDHFDDFLAMAKMSKMLIFGPGGIRVGSPRVVFGKFQKLHVVRPFREPLGTRRPGPWGFGDGSNSVQGIRALKVKFGEKFGHFFTNLRKFGKFLPNLTSPVRIPREGGVGFRLGLEPERSKRAKSRLKSRFLALFGLHDSSKNRASIFDSSLW